MLAVIFDFVAVIIIVFSIFYFSKKGFINSSYKIASIILTVVLMLLFGEPIGEFIGTSPVGEWIREHIEISVEEKIDLSEENIEAEESKKGLGILGLPSFYKSVVEDSAQKLNDAKNELVFDISKNISKSVINILSLILLYILIRVVLFVLFKMLNAFFKLPVLRSFNKLLGAVTGLLNGLFIIYILCAVLMWVIQSDETQKIHTAVEQTVVTQYFYNNNVLLELFM